MIPYFSILLLCLCHPALNVMFYDQSNISFFIIIPAFYSTGVPVLPVLQLF